jgi:antitoxin (DNA-binding transcriptional repressor) of toxin-antitoxin stability system
MGSAARVAGGIGLVACAAVIAFAAGGGGVFGGLGGLFGRDGQSLEVARSGSPAADIVAAPTAAVRRRASNRAVIGHRTEAAPRQQRRQGTGLQRSVPPRLSPSVPPSGSPPVLPPGAPPAPAPAPGGGQATGTAGGAVKQVTNQAPPPLQPLTQPAADAVDMIVKTCQAAPLCP